MKLKKITSAYTLVELLVTMVMIGMLSSISVGTYNNYIANAKVSVIKKTVNDLYRFTVLYARETDSYYSELSLAEIADKFGIKEPEFTQIAYVASDFDFFYEASLPDGTNWTVGLVPKTYAQSDEKSLHYAAGTKSGMDYFRSLTNDDRDNFIKATYDEDVANTLKSGNMPENFNFKVISSPWRYSVPDLDKDGIPDYRDKCPKEQGDPENKGCPLVDSDGDKVYDKDDLCPKEFGDRYNYGCPIKDYDKDGVLDDQDKCPEKVGEIINRGCPISNDEKSEFGDYDGDGVVNGYDECKDKAGTVKNNGCPDKDDMDGDGVSNKEDKCPEKAGTVKNNGCPVEDIKK